MAFDQQIAAITIYCEASGEPYIGKVAVAASFFNRLRAGRFGKTVAAICLKRYQYSEWNADPTNNQNLLRAAGVSDSDPVMADCLKAYSEAQAGNDPTGGATHYFSDSIAAPAWATDDKFTVKIGRHNFYKDVA